MESPYICDAGTWVTLPQPNYNSSIVPVTFAVTGMFFLLAAAHKSILEKLL